MKGFVALLLGVVTALIYGIVVVYGETKGVADSGSGATGDEPKQQALQNQAERGLGRRVLQATAAMPTPHDPFMFDNRMVGEVMVESHPVYGSASLSIRSGRVYRLVSQVGTGGASVGATRIPTSTDARKFVSIGDIVLLNQKDARTVVGIGTSAVWIDVGLQHPLTGGESIEMRKNLLSFSEDTSFQGSINSRGFKLFSRDDTVDAAGGHRTMEIRHYADYSSQRAVQLPGNVSVTYGSDAVFTSVDLTGFLKPAQFVRLAGGVFIVDPTRPISSTRFFIDRAYTGHSYDDLPIYIEGIGAGIQLEVRGVGQAIGMASLNVIAATDGMDNVTEVHMV
ncbi:hypothetical protein PINS_up005270 [Pythium insidiosum]|nr:hypothetical protein PINS_up005270 [Pythium insidiosum]